MSAGLSQLCLDGPYGIPEVHAAGRGRLLRGERSGRRQVHSQ